MYWRGRRLLCALVLLLGFLAGGRAELSGAHPHYTVDTCSHPGDYTCDASPPTGFQCHSSQDRHFSGPCLPVSHAPHPADIQYILSSPASLNGGETGKACVNIVGSTEKLDVRLILQHDGQNTSIIAEDVSSPTYFQCAAYKIPIAPKPVPVTLLLSIVGQKTKILERKTVVIQTYNSNCILQMDKPIYQPGNNVFCRIICLNSQFKPANEKFPIIYLQDPSNSRIKQWTRQETQRGVLSLEFKLIKDAPPGSYSYVVERDSSYSLSQYFTVEEYVPPRFSVTVESPNTISVLEETLSIKVSAMYTYGEPVAGTVTALYCKQPGLYGRRRNCFKEKGDLCSNITGVLGSDGVFKGTINLTGQFMGLTGMSLQMDNVVTEAETGIQVRNSHYVWVTTQPAALNFDYEALNPYYKRGIPYPIVAKLTDEQGKPMPNQDIEIEVDQGLVQTAKTDSEGKMEYGIDTSDMVSPNFTVRISYKNPDQCYYAEWRDTDYPTSEHTVFRFYSRSGSFLQAKRPKNELRCGQTHNIEVQYTMSQDGIKVGATAVTIYYLVMAKSTIVYNGQKAVDLTSSKNGSITIPLSVTADMAPSGNLVIYCILNGELVVETLSLNIEKCFKNKVDMTFSAEKGIPGSTVEVILSAMPESICGLRVIDSSLLLLNSYEPFSPESVHGLFSYGYYGGYNIGGFDVEDPEPQCLDRNKLVFFKGNYYLPVSSYTEGDSYQNLRDVGLIFVTGTQVRKPKVCDNNPYARPGRPIPFPEGKPIALSKVSVDRAFSSSGGGSAVETVRKNFADTFMWLMVPLDKEGHASLSEVVPDTITKWEGTAFCMSDGGFGMTKYPANYTTFLPFFMELSKPYSMIRGETLILTGVVHNYLDYCVKVQVELKQSASFTAKLKKGTQNACVCSKDRVAFDWEVQALALGEMSFTVTGKTTFIGKTCNGPNDKSQPSRKDTVVQTILVEPEGISQELTLSNLLFVKPGMKSKVPVNITPPKNVVPDSISAYVTAVGDVFGLPIKNLQDLVQKPYGCAEQNLARVAPIVYALDYLNSTGQLTTELLEKAKQYLLEGYYRQLGFASGPAYKVFRSSPESNSWLTAYTFKTFEQAKKYIQIDETRQQQSLIWLENTQRLENGCFIPQGSLFTFQDTNNEVHFTAYITIALLEAQYSLGKTLLDGAMACLKNASTTKQKIGNEVLMLYAFTLAGLPQYRDPLLARLMQKAIIKDGTIHWEREDMPSLRPVPFFWPIYAPAEVQLAAYMLLSMTAGIQPSNSAVKGAKPQPPQKDLSTMAQIALWLVRRQNSLGGFPSTQDTVVALQALGAFGKILYTPNSQHTIKVKGGNGDIGNLNLSPENRLLVQRQDLPVASGDYSLEIEGNGWFLSQATVKYNIPIPKENSAFSLAVSATSDKCVNGVTKIFNMTVTLIYQGSRSASGMTLINIRMLSGYRADLWSLRELENNQRISKSEENERGELGIYLESVNKNEPITLTFSVLMGNRMLNVKKSSAIVYSYYEQGENGYAEYPHPCVKPN